jgi:hypothetical protein
MCPSSGVSCTEAAALLCHFYIQVWFPSHVAVSHVRYSYQLRSVIIQRLLYYLLYVIYYRALFCYL